MPASSLPIPGPPSWDLWHPVPRPAPAPWGVVFKGMHLGPGAVPPPGIGLSVPQQAQNDHLHAGPTQHVSPGLFFSHKEFLDPRDSLGP